MQVNHVEDFVTHAVIGGAETVDFAVSNSAEFFQILSSTLYKNQKLAMVREVLCNAWDAHIASGRADQYLEVTLNEKLVIRDFGLGIPHSSMGTIYGTYGNSTKTNDGNQTGGFGLGCKAPFAYTDHFEVISSHEGTKTIYALSKSSAEVGGKPGITKLASFPTTESGLSVSINISKSDKNIIDEYIYEIAYFGDMLVNYNGKPLPKLNFNTTPESNYLIGKFESVVQSSIISLRYGNVVYPIEFHQDYGLQYKKVSSILCSMSNHVNIIFHAEPNSISVTPSRESLSMQEHTIKSIKKLLDDFINNVVSQVPKMQEDSIHRCVHNAIKHNRIELVLSNDLHKVVKYCHEPLAKLDKYITCPQDIADIITHRSNNSPRPFKEEYIYRINELIKLGHIQRGDGISFLKALTNRDFTEPRTRWGRTYQKRPWLLTNIVGPLLAKIQADPNMSVSRVILRDSLLNGEDISSIRRNFVPALRARAQYNTGAVPYLRKWVVLTKSITNVEEKVNAHFGNAAPDSYVIYHVSTKIADINNARKFFTDSNFNLIDLTVRTEEELIEIAENRALKQAAPPRKKGLPCLIGASSKNYGILLGNLFEDSAPRIEEPEYVIHIPRKAEMCYNRFNSWTSHVSEIFMKLWGDKGGVCSTKSTYNAWIKKGVLSIEQFMANKLSEGIIGNPEIAKFISVKYRMKDLMHKSNNKQMFALMESNTLLEFFGIKNVLSESNRNLLDMAQMLRNSYSVVQLCPDLFKWIDEIPLDPLCEKAITAMESTFAPLINFEGFGTLLNYAKKDPKQYEHLTQMFYNIIESKYP